MKTERFSGTKSILCNALPAILLLMMAGCMAASENTYDPGNKEAALETMNSETGNNTEVEPEIETEVNTGVSSVDVSFDFERMSTLASNQIAVWAEDSNGMIVKTIQVTDFTAKRRGYRNRGMSLSGWVYAADPDEMSDAQIDSISGATPASGHQIYTWDLTDESGTRVPDGIYTLNLEGTLYWESYVRFKATVHTGQEKRGELQTEMIRNEPENHENEDMITNVRFSAYSLPGGE